MIEETLRKIGSDFSNFCKSIGGSSLSFPEEKTFHGMCKLPEISDAKLQEIVDFISKEDEFLVKSLSEEERGTVRLEFFSSHTLHEPYTGIAYEIRKWGNLRGKTLEFTKEVTSEHIPEAISFGDILPPKCNYFDRVCSCTENIDFLEPIKPTYARLMRRTEEAVAIVRRRISELKKYGERIYVEI
ncbi:hypothetical protein [Candidatus Methanodesulfokora washburnensis]|uniref:Uncharacterized protein n=1 Tax=Candidatus Methanodesulfokora washburnensis TaxID=2478471 RepID=A0A429GF45_9CREN|nr:hypothetical protein [Candidatus Methanodesulfokores washburnensis]RSN72456.1 hypothetical protein D6D85_13680 [Candidatus Methanodesulfokores washburnensis]